MRLSESTIRRLQTQLGLHECSFERLRDFARAIEAEVSERCAKHDEAIAAMQEQPR